MVRRSLLPVTLAALAILGTFSSVALASSSSGGGGNGAPGLAALPPAQTTSAEYTATYTDERFGPVVCVGKHQTNSRKFPGTGTSGGRDIFTCKSNTFNGLKRTPLTGVAPDEILTWGPESWAWDYFAVTFSLFVLDTHGSGEVNARGTAYHAVIYY
jgi:hypothetical protein